MKSPSANKDLGQHFLNSPSIIKKICSDKNKNIEAIIEVGPGPAVLTRELVTYKLPYKVVELDQRFKANLEEFIDPAQIIFDDALKVDIQSLFPEKKIWLVSNLPYNISAPLIVKFLQIPSIVHMTLMMQKEVAEKVLPRPDEKNTANSLGFLTQAYFKVSKLIDAPPGAFSPPPKVHSRVLSFTRLEAPLVPMEQFTKYESFLRKLFSQKRKQIHKVMGQHFSKEQLLEAFRELSIEKQQRSETLNLQDVISLFYRLNSK